MKLNPAQEALDRSFRAQDRKQEEADLRAILSTPHGRRWFLRLIGQTGVYGHSERGDDLPYRAGRRDIGIEIMHDANDVAADMVLLARQERHVLISERNQAMKNLEQKEAHT